MATPKTALSSWDNWQCQDLWQDPTYSLVSTMVGSDVGFVIGVCRRENKDKARMNLPFDSLKSIAITSEVGAIDNIIQYSWICIENWVHKTNRAFAVCKALLIQLSKA
jgi:hypothetical protein